MKFVIYCNYTKPSAQQWHWQLKGKNGEIVAQGEGHPTAKAARAAIKRIKWGAPLARVMIEE